MRSKFLRVGNKRYYSRRGQSQSLLNEVKVSTFKQLVMSSGSKKSQSLLNEVKVSTETAYQIAPGIGRNPF